MTASDPEPPPALIERLNRIADVEYAVNDTERNRLLRQRRTIRRQIP